MKITKDMTIATIMGLVPNSANIIFDHGLHCIGCHGSAYETLLEGATTHGLTEKDVDSIVSDINEHAESYDKNIKKHKFSVTNDAVNIIKSFIEENSNGGLEVEIKEGLMDRPEYYNELVKEMPEGYEVLDYEGVKIFIHKDSKEFFDEVEIDYVADDYRQGFTFAKPIELK